MLPEQQLLLFIFLAHIPTSGSPDMVAQINSAQDEPFSSLLSCPLLRADTLLPCFAPGIGPLLHQSDQARRVVGPSTRQSSTLESLDEESWLRLPLQTLPFAERVPWPLWPLLRRLRDELHDESSSCDGW